MTEATVTITPAEMVTLPKRSVALLTNAARLFQDWFDGNMTTLETIEGAILKGLTTDRDCDDDERESLGVDTQVVLSPEFMRALEEAEEICGLAGDEADG